MALDNKRPGGLTGKLDDKARGNDLTLETLSRTSTTDKGVRLFTTRSRIEEKRREDSLVLGFYVPRN